MASLKIRIMIEICIQYLTHTQEIYLKQLRMCISNQCIAYRRVTKKGN